MPPEILEKGIECIQWVQLDSEWVTQLFWAITSLGDERFYFLLLPALAFNWDDRKTFKMAVLLLLTAWLNQVLKEIIGQPRPFAFAPELNLTRASGYGLPSGHAQVAVVFWGSLAFYMNSFRWWWAAILALTIGFSRIYLGVHFPTDVLVGWAIGSVLLWGYIAFHKRIERSLGRLRAGHRFFLIVVDPILLAYLLPMGGAPAFMGAVSGLCVGFVMADFSVSNTGTPFQRLTRYLIAVVGLFAIGWARKSLLVGDSESLLLVTRYLGYFMMGCWLTYLCPLLCLRFGLLTTNRQVSS